jgi:hypothetical protein
MLVGGCILTLKKYETTGRAECEIKIPPGSESVGEVPQDF